MKKNEILKGLSQVQQELIDTKLKLNNLLSSPIWDTVVTSELDDTVTVLRGINDNINDIIEIQKKIAISKYNKK